MISCRSLSRQAVLLVGMMRVALPVEVQMVAVILAAPLQRWTTSPCSLGPLTRLNSGQPFSPRPFSRLLHWSELASCLTKDINLHITVVSLPSSYFGGSEMSELGDCSVIHMLTGWTPLVFPVKTKSTDEIWNSLVDVLPLWKRDDPQATEDQKKQKKCLVLAGFTSIQNKRSSKPLSPSQTQAIVSVCKIIPTLI